MNSGCNVSIGRENTLPVLIGDYDIVTTILSVLTIPYTEKKRYLCTMDKLTKQYRTGPLGGLMDKYERDLRELQGLLNSLSNDDYTRICDPDTPDPDCRSVQTIIRHVTSSGFGYATYIGQEIEVTRQRPEIPLLAKDEAIKRLDDMFEYSLQTFEGKWAMTEDEMGSVVFKTGWSEYDIESMLEHAIVHVLRHRRQIEKLLGL